MTSIARSSRLRSAAYEAIVKWGLDAQTDMVSEECAELIAVINRFKRGRVGPDAVAEEAADVYITLEFIRILVGSDKVDAAIAAKLTRLEGRLK